MKKYANDVWILLLIFCIPAAFAANESRYILDDGDRISIHVQGKRQLSMDISIEEEKGEFYFPYLGKVHASGVSLIDLQKMIERGLLDYFADNPKVTIHLVKNYDSKHNFIRAEHYSTSIQ